MNENGGSVADVLGEIRVQLAELRTQVTELIKRVDPVITDFEQRVRKLEAENTEMRTQFRVWLAVVGAAATGGGTGLGALLAHFTGA
jgi:hypothetical protein